MSHTHARVHVSSQVTSSVLMIRPVRFAGNVQTAPSNRFQQVVVTQDAADIQGLAVAEFDNLVMQLRAAGVQVQVIEDTPEPHTPDSIFPNNWVSFHADGSVVLYPMLAPNRRLERRAEILQAIQAQGYEIKRVIDMTHHEAAAQFLEGTGSMVLDRVNGRVYACWSPRTHAQVLEEFARYYNYQVIAFSAADAGAPVYHTNVLLCVGSHFAVLCGAVLAAEDRQRVLQSLRETGHEVIDISVAQLRSFAGNMLALQTANGTSCIALSQRAHTALTPAQRQRLQALGGEFIIAAIPTIERLGGGSVRCMLAEVFLPRAPG